MGFFEYLSPNSVAKNQTGVRTDFNKPVYKEFVQGKVQSVITYDGSLGSNKDFYKPKELIKRTNNKLIPLRK